MNASMQGHLAMLVFSALVAGSFSLGSLIANQIDPTALTAIRMLLAAVLIGAVACSTGAVSRTAFQAPWRYLLLGGLFAFYFVMMFEGLKTAPPISTSAVFTMTPIISGLFGWLLMRQVMTGRMLMALVIGGLGALWVIFRADIGAMLGLEVGRGEMVFFIGCVAHALYTPMVRYLNRGEPAIVFTFGTLIGGTVLLVVYAWSALIAIDWLAFTALVWVAIAYLTVFATATSFWLVQIATLRLPSAKVMAYTYLVPVWVILWQIVLGDALPAFKVLAGIGPILLALALLLKESTSRGHRCPSPRPDLD